MLYGGIAGDIIGSRFEFNPRKDEEFELFDKACTYTDDTVLTVALVEAILDEKPWAEHAKKYAQEYPSAGYGGNFVKWANSMRSEPYNSWGNGSAMRVGPVAYAVKTLEECLEESKASAEITHNHVQGIKGAQAASSAMFLALDGQSKDQIRDYIEKEFGYNLSRKYSDIQPSYRFHVSCQKSVPESIICFLESNSWEDCIRKCVAMGGDCDTMACIAGNIAEAFYGEIDEKILGKTQKFLPEEFIKVLEKFNNRYKRK